MPEGFGSIEDLKVAITAQTGNLESGLAMARQQIAAFGEYSGRDVKKFDTALEALGGRVDWLKGRIGVWLSVAEQVMSIVGKLSAMGDKHSEAIGVKDDWDAVKTGVTDLAGEIGNALTFALGQAKDKMQAFAGATQEANTAWSLFDVKQSERYQILQKGVVEMLEEATHKLRGITKDDTEQSDKWIDQEIAMVQKRIQRIKGEIEKPPPIPIWDALWGMDAAGQLAALRKELEVQEALAERLGMIAASRWAKISEVEKWPEATSVDLSEKLIKALENEVRAMRQKSEAHRMAAGDAAAYLAQMRLRNQAEDQGIALTEAAEQKMRKLAGTIGALTQAEADRRKSEQDLKAFERIVDGLEKHVAQIEHQTVALLRGAAAAARMATEEKALADAKSRGLALTEEQVTRIRAFAAETALATERLERLKSTMALIKESGDLVTRSLAQAFEKFMDGTEVKGRDMVASLLREFAKLTLMRNVLQPAQTGLQGMFGSLLGGGSIGDWSTSILPAFAAGGYAESGKAAIVGEAGQELFIPNTSGSVVSNDQVREAMGQRGSGSPNLVLTINAPNSTPDSVKMLEARIPDLVVQTFHDARERGIIQ